MCQFFLDDSVLYKLVNISFNLAYSLKVLKEEFGWH